MISFVLVLLALVSLAALVFPLINAYRQKSRLGVAIVAATAFHELVLVVFPTVYSVVTGYRLEEELAVFAGPSELATVMLGEAIFVIAFAVPLTFVRWATVRPIRQPSQHASDRELVVVLAGMGAVFFVGDLLAPGLSAGEYVATLEPAARNAVGGQMLLKLAEHVLWFAALVAGATTLAPRRPTRYSLVVRSLGLTEFVALLSVALATGVRGRITWVASIVTIVSYLNGRKAPIYACGLFLCIAVPFFPFLGGEARQIYIDGIRTGESRVESAISVVGEMRGAKADDKGIVHSSAERAQAARNSIVLYKMCERGECLGLKHYASVVLPIPAFLWPSKPLPGSIDGTVFGTAIFLVMRLGHGSEVSTMGPVLASAHAYWEAGWLGVGIIGLLTGIFWRAHIRWCEGLSWTAGAVIGLIPLGTWVIDGFFTTLAPLHLLIRGFWVCSFPAFVLYKGICLAFGRLGEQEAWPTAHRAERSSGYGK